MSVYRTVGRLVTIYGNGGHLGHVAWTIYINVLSPFPMRLNMDFGFDWPSGFRGEDIWRLWTDVDDNEDARRWSLSIL